MKSIDQHCGRPKGGFKTFLERMSARIKGIESERQANIAQMRVRKNKIQILTQEEETASKAALALRAAISTDGCPDGWVLGYALRQIESRMDAIKAEKLSLPPPWPPSVR